jgi:thioredoxin-related protein
MNFRLLIALLFIGSVILINACNHINASNVVAIEETTAGLKWYDFENAMELNKKAKKKVLVDMYTSWCGWCKVMDRQTFTDPEVVEYLNENFILIKFNAETREPVEYKGQTYTFKPMGRRGANGLAIQMLNGRLAYPSLVYLDADFNKLKVSPGFKKPQQLLSELKAL